MSDYGQSFCSLMMYRAQQHLGLRTALSIPMKQQNTLPRGWHMSYFVHSWAPPRHRRLRGQGRRRGPRRRARERARETTSDGGEHGGGECGERSRMNE